MRKNSSKSVRPLDQSDILEAIAEVAQMARRNGVSIALIGGCALHLYGSDRFTADVDFVADALLGDLPRGAALSFGGEQTQTRAGVPIDLIIRDDRWAPLYEAALETAKRIPGSKALVVRPEHLLAMKMQARRPKDEADIDFLLGTKGVINHNKARKVVGEFLGGYAEEELDSLVAEYEWKRNRR